MSSLIARLESALSTWPSRAWSSCWPAACCGALRASAAWRHLAWSLGVAGLLLLPLLSLALPAWRVSWLPQWTATGTMRSRIGQSTQSIASAAVTNVSPAHEVAAARADRCAGRAACRHQRSQMLQPQCVAIDQTPAGWSWPALVIAGWLGGLVLALSPLAVGLWQLRRLRRGSTRVTDAGWLSLLDELREQLGVRQSGRLRRSPAATMPLTWGALSAGAADSGRGRCMAARAAADGAAARAGPRSPLGLADAAGWPMSPAPCIGSIRWSGWRPGRCGSSASGPATTWCSPRGAKASDYAQELLALAAGLADPRLSTLAAVPMARRRVLEDRLRAILDRGRSRAALTTAAVCLARPGCGGSHRAAGDAAGRSARNPINR